MASMELKQFIHKVRDEIKEAYDERPEKTLLSLEGVELEISFSLSGTGGGKGKLLVIDLEGEVSAERTHKVTLHLVPNAPPEAASTKPGGVDLSKIKLPLPIAGVGVNKRKGIY